MTARAEWLEVAGDPSVWRSLGLVVDEDGFIPLMGTSVRVETQAESGATGIVGWALSGVDAGQHGDIDGIATTAVDPRPPTFAHHELGASGLDHVVVMTADLERTSRAIEASTGAELKRIREVGAMRQGFHRLGRGGLIVELVSRPEMPDGPARFWGLVINVDDLDAACERIGPDRVSAPKDAVQPGRRIATIGSEVGLGLPVALMTT
ncbi:VOC family protein [Ilumatobacter sp.]|uniref:VOC family protein n=1 Tax=Ilumatobacter sp. TaxID=1967498 RepID=UPI003C3F7713